MATRTPSEHTSKLAPVQMTTDPEVVLRHASGCPTSLAQRRAMAHSLVRASRLPPATYNGSST
eukprot:3423947-Alexandrium_andersonii.AAC.1